jgi:hypothetical protein
MSSGARCRSAPKRRGWRSERGANERQKAEHEDEDEQELARLLPPVFYRRIRSVTSMARSSAIALFIVSWNSVSGTESATMPPPAWT